ncbi:hypothetical protein K438DRAFT_1767688 [Mycena galopus ATCC 62051]|nr:hypothetical protein K438DRAFT_1767688 [Mycena galopus ATCC 62051]
MVCLAKFPLRRRSAAGSLPGVKVASLYHIGCLVLDVFSMGMTVTYAWKFSNTSRSALSMLAQTTLEDGVMYFIALTEQGHHAAIIRVRARPRIHLWSCGIDGLRNSSLGFAVTMIFSSRLILNLSERTRNGLSGDTSHTSRTPHGGHNCTDNPELVVTVMKDVITIRDMDETQSAGQAKEGQWGAEDRIMPCTRGREGVKLSGVLPAVEKLKRGSNEGKPREKVGDWMKRAQRGRKKTEEGW